MIAKDTRYDVYDYGDQLTPVLPDLLPQDCPKPDMEPRQCFYLHVAAGLLAHAESSIPSLSQVRVKASNLQRETFQMAQECLESLGPEPELCTHAEEDLRTFVHDAVFFGHDKD